ncbi:uncharacterized protein F5147DRAFT_133758 [Suillus discolor]|uniref:Uncharacterized protein n=1 Tax=Suillus discolor TaxID=1912936 RepID=A0A9P7F9M7_9AGAM|nr:uncharacterized protein F5147DRAFT_133758 [Suillus discolor]KAG2110235.1 hypothetical protein F5147DRAFT_133758 [Suillus discolor]
MNQLFTIYFVFAFFGEIFAAGMVGFFAPVGFLSPFMLSITLLSFLLALLHVRLVHTVLSAHKTDPPVRNCLLSHAAMGSGFLVVSIEVHSYDITQTLPLKGCLGYLIIPVFVCTLLCTIIFYRWSLGYCADRQDLGSLGDVCDLLLSRVSSCIASHTNTPETLPQALSEPFTEHYLRFDTPMSPVSHTAAGTDVLPQPYYQLSDHDHRERKSDEESCIGLHV